MAENTTEENTKSEENKMSENSADNRAVSSDKENHEQMDINKPSTSKEVLDVTLKKDKIEDLLGSEKQQDGSKTDCNGDLKEEINPDKTIDSKTTKTESIKAETLKTETLETKENNSDDFRSTETKFAEEDTLYTTTIDSNLKEILKMVHGELVAMEMLQVAGVIVKDSDEENNEKEQQMVKKEDEVSKDHMADSAKKCTTSPAAKDKRDSRGSSDQTDEKSNFGIVHSPTAIGELIEEQLASNSALSTDRTDHIVEWVKNSVVNTNEEDNIVEECKSEIHEKNSTNEAENRKRLSVTPPFISPRKSQKIVSNIIKKSIKW